MPTDRARRTMNRDLRAVELGSTRLSLRSFVAEDVPEIFTFATPAIARFMTWEPAPSLSALAEIAGTWLSLMEAGTDLFVVVRLTSTRDFIGMLGVHADRSLEPEIGIWIRQESQGRGYGREAVATTIAWASERFGATGFIYPVAVENGPSRRLAESLGGRLVGNRELRKPSGIVLPEAVYRIPAMAPSDG